MPLQQTTCEASNWYNAEKNNNFQYALCKTVKYGELYYLQDPFSKLEGQISLPLLLHLGKKSTLPIPPNANGRTSRISGQQL